MSDRVVIVEESSTVSVGSSGTRVSISTGDATVVSAGTQGPPGVDGEGDKHYSQPFTNSASVTVAHNLGKYPAVSVKDSAGDEVTGFEINHQSLNSLTLVFTASFTGVAFCN